MPKLKTMLPFLDEDELDQLADAIIASGDGQYQGLSAAALAPFLDDDKVNELFLAEVKRGGNYKALLPFVDDETLDRMVDQDLEKGHGADLKYMLPFMDEETVAKLFRKALDGQLAGLDLTALLPFMDDEELVDQAFLQAAAQGQDYRRFLPFVSEDCMHKLAQAYCQGDIDKSLDIDSLYQYMDDDDIKMIFCHATGQPYTADESKRSGKKKHRRQTFILDDGGQLGQQISQYVNQTISNSLSGIFSDGHPEEKQSESAPDDSEQPATIRRQADQAVDEAVSSIKPAMEALKNMFRNSGRDDK